MFLKKLFNSLVAKKERIIKIVDGSAREIIDTGTVNVTERDGTVRALEVVQYVSEARCNLISIKGARRRRMLDLNATRHRHI